MTNTLRYAARSDIGLQRDGNEDSGYADSHLLIVADGMGGHAAGELASAMAVATFAEVAEQSIPADEVLESLADGVGELTERIGDVIAADPSNQGMGTTITGMYWFGDRVGIVHVGDSRAYRLRDGELSQITKDHTFVQTLVDSGEITAEAATTHPRRNLLIRAMDGIHPVEADLSMRETRPGDRYLLCSDGLSGVVSDAALAEVMRADADPTGAVTRLVDMALEGGAPDNVTVVVADVLDSEKSVDEGLPVVVGAAGEPANRARLPHVPWPVDEQLDPNDPQPRRQAPPAAEPDQGPDTQPIAPITPEAPAPGRPRWVTVTIASVATFVVVLAVVGAGLLWWVNGQWYVSTDDDRVAIYHGVPGSLGPIPLQSLDETADVNVAELPTVFSSRLDPGIVTSSKEQAQEIVQELANVATECQAEPKTPGCPQSAEPQATPPGVSPDLTPAPTATTGSSGARGPDRRARG